MRLLDDVICQQRVSVIGKLMYWLYISTPVIYCQKWYCQNLALVSGAKSVWIGKNWQSQVALCSQFSHSQDFSILSSEYNHTYPNRTGMYFEDCPGLTAPASGASSSCGQEGFCTNLSSGWIPMYSVPTATIPRLVDLPTTIHPLVIVMITALYTLYEVTFEGHLEVLSF